MKFITEVKFRGKDILTGKILFGDLIHVKDELQILEFGSKIARTVDKDSVAISYDEDGREVYDDDIVESEGDKCHTKIFIELEMEWSGIDTYDFGDRFYGWKVSEGEDDND